MPLRQDLSGFWAKCERAINGLSPAFDVDDLAHAQIVTLAPYMLGEPAWAPLH